MFPQEKRVMANQNPGQGGQGGQHQGGHSKAARVASRAAAGNRSLVSKVAKADNRISAKARRLVKLLSPGSPGDISHGEATPN